MLSSELFNSVLVSPFIVRRIRCDGGVFRGRNVLSNCTVLNYTVSQKNFTPLALCKFVKSTDFQNFSIARKLMKFATKTYDMTYLILGMLLHYLGNLKFQIFCRYSVDIKENVNKLHLIALILIHICVWLYAECIYVFYQNLVLVAGYYVTCWQILLWRLLWRISGVTN